MGMVAMVAGGILFGAPKRMPPATWLVCLALFFFIGGIWRFSFSEKSFENAQIFLAPYEDRVVKVRGVVVADVEERARGRMFVIASEEIAGMRASFRIQVTTDSIASIAYGNQVVVEGTLVRPSPFTSENDRTFLYEEYLRAQNIAYTMPFASVSVSDPPNQFSPLRYVFAGKHAFVASIQRMLPEPHAGFASGLLLGEKHALGDTWEDIFRDVGVIHIVVLSGYNLTIVAESIMRLLSFTFRPRTRMVIGIGIIMLFAAMVGFSATVVRAALMASLVLFARATGRVSSALHGLLFAGIGMLLLNPYVLVFDPGFQLSFLATIGLIFLSPLVEKILQWVPTTLQIREYVTATIATQLFVTPFLLYSMGTFSVVSLFANALILSAVPFAMLFSFVAGMLGIVFGDVVVFLAFPAYLVLSYMLFIAERLSALPFASVSVPPFSFLYVVGAYVVMVVCMWFLWKKEKQAPQ